MMKIVFLCGARDFHAMDWYKSAKKKLGVEKVAVMTDIISAEGMKCLVQPDDELIKLYIIDKWLFKNPSRIGHIWRNVLKILVMPIQIKKLKKYYAQHPDTVYHAHGMYYMQMARKAGVPYVGTPQGSEILVRPYASKSYWNFAKEALQGAKAVTVDSVNMQKGAEKIAGVKPYIVQNGIDVKSIMNYLTSTKEEQRTVWLSMRGLTPLYREEEILRGRNESQENNNHPIEFVYPFDDVNYKEQIKPLLKDEDKIIGRLQRDELYCKMHQTEIVFSIPKSDSSPRSVYESIFLGCPVIITWNAYYDVLPECMQKRIIIADIDSPGWFDKAVAEARKLANVKFLPTEEAIELFDQETNFEKIFNLLMK